MPDVQTLRMDKSVSDNMVGNRPQGAVNGQFHATTPSGLTEEKQALQDQVDTLRGRLQAVPTPLA